MAPNMLLLAYNPDITGLTTETAAKGSRLHRLYDFIVETQSRRAEQETGSKIFCGFHSWPLSQRL